MKFTQGFLLLDRWAEIIQQHKLHILILPEFGMDPTIVKLGCNAIVSHITYSSIFTECN